MQAAAMPATGADPPPLLGHATPALIAPRRPQHASRRKGARPEDNREDVRRYGPLWWGVPLLCLAVIIAAGIVFTVIADSLQDRRGDNGGLEPVVVDTSILVLRSGPADSAPAEIASIGEDEVWFTADDGSGRAVWSYDATTKTATKRALVADASGFIGLGTRYVFFAGTNATFGNELHMYDRLSGETRVATDINVGAFGSSPSFLVAGSDDAIYFAATEPGAGRELWRFDPAGDTTTLAFDVEGGSASSTPTDLVVIDDTVYFSAQTSVQGRELYYYRTDGSGDKAMINIFNPGLPSTDLTGLAVLAGTHVCGAGRVGASGMELICYSTVSETGGMIQDLNEGASSSFPTGMTEHDGDLFFSAVASSELGTELYRYDVFSGTIKLAGNIRKGSSSSSPRDFASVGSYLYFTAIGNDGIRRMYAFDFSQSSSVVDVRSKSGNDDIVGPDDLTPLGDKLFYAFETDDEGIELHFLSAD
jgi:ELWxxDGT repeat protein